MNLLHLWSKCYAGAHMVVLGTYAHYGPDSQQQRWLRADLAAFSRDRTPWLIVAMHAPWCAFLCPSVPLCFLSV